MTVDPTSREAFALDPVAPGYLNVLRLRLASTWLPFVIGALAVDNFVLADSPVHGLLSILVPLLAIISGLTAPKRIYRRLLYRVDERLLQVMRGWLFHTDTIVPFVRVQHLDVTRGPLDKMFGTATLVVHTAGTHNSIVTLPGLAPERAEEIRDIIREHVWTDFA
ncbi:MAG TPA: PH domain-containing protein [Sphingomicrobium sp.]|jgi:hypothetical protein